MKITPKFQFVEGSFDTETTKMVCICSDKYQEVELSFKTNNDTGMNVVFAKIKLYSRDLFKDAKETYEDACKFGKEIERRWNECETKN